MCHRRRRLFSRAQLFLLPKRSTNTSRNSVFSCSGVLLPSLRRTFFNRSAYATGFARRTLRLPIPPFSVNRNVKIIFCARENWWKKWKNRRGFYASWRGWLDFLRGRRRRSAPNKLIGSKVIAPLRPLWHWILLINSPIESHTCGWQHLFASPGPQKRIFQPLLDQ